MAKIGLHPPIPPLCVILPFMGRISRAVTLVKRLGFGILPDISIIGGGRENDIIVNAQWGQMDMAGHRLTNQHHLFLKKH